MAGNLVGQEQFWRHVEKTDGCWWWRGSVHTNGYGEVKVAKKRILAHRRSWLLTFGDIPEGLCVLHRCDHPLCVRPDHLWLGTVVDNNRDRSTKGRTARVRPSVYGTAKLSFEKADEIRKRYSGAWGEMGKLAREYNVSRSVVSDILARKSWTIS